MKRTVGINVRVGKAVICCGIPFREGRVTDD